MGWGNIQQHKTIYIVVHAHNTIAIQQSCKQNDGKDPSLHENTQFKKQKQKSTLLLTLTSGQSKLLSIPEQSYYCFPTAHHHTTPNPPPQPIHGLTNNELCR